MALDLPPVEVRIGARDAMLYALSVGAGRDPLDPWLLRFVYEKNLAVLPGYAMVLGRQTDWVSDPLFGITLSGMVNGGQRLHSHRPLRRGELLVAHNHVRGVTDIGRTGALILMERILRDSEGVEVAQVDTHLMCRSDGGGGSLGTSPEPFVAVPDREPDESFPLAVPVDAALLFRLNGDYNPIHAVPTLAQAAGFPVPILHGQCSYGMVLVSLAHRRRQGGRARLISTHVRFSAPTLPGERLDVDVWREGPDKEVFRVRSHGRGQIVLDRGYVEYGEGEWP